MPCPRCTVTIAELSEWIRWGEDSSGSWQVETLKCPACGRSFVTIVPSVHRRGRRARNAAREAAGQRVIWPRTSPRAPVSAYVTEPYASLAQEAALILAYSPRASAVLSRRCLQRLLRDMAGAPHGTLYDEIGWAVANGGLPPRVQESLDELRIVGNMAAQPSDSTATGDYLEVAAGEADRVLDTVEALFAHYFVEPGNP